MENPNEDDLVELVWPGKDRTKSPRVVGIEAVPRLCFSATMANMMHTQAELGGIPYSSATSCSFHVGMHKAIANAKALYPGAEYFLAFDFDSVFTPQNVIDLIRIMDDNPNFDAVFPVQIHRAHLRPFFYDDDRDYLGSYTEMDGFGHFGLTLIRSAVFSSDLETKTGSRMVPKPWFVDRPDEEGNYGGGGLDADISFWRMLHRKGGKIIQANHVEIGHMELMILWPNGTRVAVQEVTNWESGGPPENRVPFHQGWMENRYKRETTKRRDKGRIMKKRKAKKQ